MLVARATSVRLFACFTRAHNTFALRAAVKHYQVELELLAAVRGRQRSAIGSGYHQMTAMENLVPGGWEKVDRFTLAGWQVSHGGVTNVKLSGNRLAVVGSELAIVGLC